MFVCVCVCACMINTLPRTNCSFLKNFFTWTFLKSLLNLLRYCFWFMFWVFLAMKMWHISSQFKDQTHTPCTGRRSLNHWTLNHWTTRDVLNKLFLKDSCPLPVCNISSLRMGTTSYYLNFPTVLSTIAGVKSIYIKLYSGLFYMQVKVLCQYKGYKCILLLFFPNKTPTMTKYN